MADMTVQVTESMGDFIKWASEKGKEQVMDMIRERLLKLKEFDANNPHMKDENGFVWDQALDPNDGDNQWKHGGDCNKCRKVGYCLTKCRANKLLKNITTPFLYQCYLDEHPEIAAKEMHNRITPEDFVKMVGAQ